LKLGDDDEVVEIFIILIQFRWNKDVEIEAKQNYLHKLSADK